MTLQLLENRARLDKAGTSEVTLRYDRRHARGQVGEHENGQGGEVHFAGLKIYGLGQGVVLRQQETVAADRRLRFTGAAAGKGEKGVVRRIAGGNRVQRLDAFEPGPVGRMRGPTRGHEVPSDSTHTPAEEPQKVCPGRADERLGPGDGAALLDVPASGRGVEHGGHQAEPEDRQERDVELDGHRLEDEYSIALAKIRLAQQGSGPGGSVQRSEQRSVCACPSAPSR